MRSHHRNLAAVVTGRRLFDRSAGAVIGTGPHPDQTEPDPLPTPGGRQAGGGGVLVPGTVRVRPGSAPDLGSGNGVAEAVPPIGQALTQRRRGVGSRWPSGINPIAGALGWHRPSGSVLGNETHR
jgi:hypothetical protein